MLKNFKKLNTNKSKVKKLIKETVPLNRFGTTGDISYLVSYLISKKEDFINGSIFIVDGGQAI